MTQHNHEAITATVNGLMEYLKDAHSPTLDRVAAYYAKLTELDQDNEPKFASWLDINITIANTFKGLDKLDEVKRRTSALLAPTSPHPEPTGQQHRRKV